MHCANFPRRIITRRLIAHPMAPTQLNWLIGHAVRFYRGIRAKRRGIVSPSAFGVLASAPGGSFGRCH